ncbi:hypothetical protein KQI63_13440 [bacterium]|nr:hypothetical protein [bacterium]
MRRMLMLFCAVLMSATLFAQPPTPNPDVPDPQWMRRERINERIEAMRIWKLTEALSLDADRAVVFFPRYKVYLATMDSLEMKRMDILQAISVGVEADSSMDYKAKVSEIQRTSRAILDQQEAFLKQNSDVLSEKEQAAFIMFEHRFHQRLRDIVRDLRRDHAPPATPPPPFPEKDHRRRR